MLPSYHPCMMSVEPRPKRGGKPPKSKRKRMMMGVKSGVSSYALVRLLMNNLLSYLKVMYLLTQCGQWAYFGYGDRKIREVGFLIYSKSCTTVNTSPIAYICSSRKPERQMIRNIHPRSCIRFYAVFCNTCGKLILSIFWSSWNVIISSTPLSHDMT